MAARYLMRDSSRSGSWGHQRAYQETILLGWQALLGRLVGNLGFIVFSRREGPLGASSETILLGWQASLGWLLGALVSFSQGVSQG